MSRYNGDMASDRIDKILEQWQRESPQLDLSALAVVGRVLRIARLFEKHREAVLSEFDLNIWSFDLLATLRRQGPPYQLKPTDLYALLMLSSGAMTNRIDRLEHEDLVIRIRDVRDRRGVIVQLTPKGIELTDRVMPVLFDREQQLLAQFSADPAPLTDLLRQLLIALEPDPK